MAQTWLWRHPEWPRLHYDVAALAVELSSARREQGKVIGLYRAVGLAADAAEAQRAIWTEEALATAAIEGEKLDLGTVRSSVMRRLGVDEENPGRIDRHVEGLLDVMQDATTAYRRKLDRDRLERWQSALFPGGTAGLHRIAVGRYRDHGDPMQIVSGAIGREKVHYEAPPSKAVDREMKRFLAWWEATRPGHARAMDGIARAAIAHLWFETIHPFEDGNGRVGRALVDMALAQDLDGPQRIYSVSRRLMAVRRRYYGELNAAQRGAADVTAWVAFFAGQFRLACITSQGVIEGALEKSRFWAAHAGRGLNERQRKVMQRLLDAGKGGFEGGMSAEKYAHLAGVSKSTATRDLGALQQAGLLVTTGQMKGTRYWVNLPGWGLRLAAAR